MENRDNISIEEAEDLSEKERQEAMSNVDSNLEKGKKLDEDIKNELEEKNKKRKSKGDANTHLESPTTIIEGKTTEESSFEGMGSKIIKGLTEKRRKTKAGKRELLQEKWEEFKQLKENIGIEPDDGKKKSLIERGDALYGEIKDEYKEETGKEFTKDIKEEAVAKKGVKFKRVKEYREELEKKAALEVAREKNTILKQVKKEKCDAVIEKQWNKLSEKGKEYYKNEKGEIDIQEYAKKWDEQMDAANQQLEDHRIKLSREVFYEMVDKGYKVEEIKGRIFSKDNARGVVTVISAGCTAISIPFLAPLGPLGGGILAGMAGLTAASWKLREKVFGKRFYGGVNLPTVDNKKNSLSQGELELLVSKMERETNQAIEGETEGRLKIKRQGKQAEIEAKIKKGRERFKEIKNETADQVIRDLSKGKDENKREVKEPEKLDEILRKEFDQFTKEVPPIGEEPLYVGMEVNQLRRASLEERSEGKGKKERESINEKYIARQEALGLCYNFIQRELENNPDTDRKVLEGWVEQFGAKYGFDANRVEIAKEVIDKYYTQRDKAKEFAKKYEGNNKDLIRELAGKELTPEELKGVSKVSVEQSTITIEASEEITKKLFSEKAIAASLAGFFNGDKEVHFIVVNKNYREKERIKSHELQHAHNNLFGAEFRTLETQVEKDRYAKAPQEKKAEVLEGYLLAERKMAWGKIKEELLATLHHRSLAKLQEKWKDIFFKKESPYSYLDKVKKSQEYRANPALSEKIFGKAYEDVVPRAIKALADLLDKKKGGYSMARAINFLSLTDIEFWPTNVRRVLKRKSK